jgi:hypothetical protein
MVYFEGLIICIIILLISITLYNLSKYNPKIPTHQSIKSSFEYKLKYNVYLMFKSLNAKRADLKRIIFIFMFVTMFYFLFLSSLPGNNHILCFVGAVDECTGNDGDLSSELCTAYGGCYGGPAWQIGGEVDGSTCCGDDLNNNVKNLTSDESSMDNGYADNSTDMACCLASTDCIDDGSCYNTDTTPKDVDNDGDDDYCDAGTWRDCIDDSGCSGSYVCQYSTKNCIDGDGSIILKNLGTSGIELTNQDYTSTRNVFLQLSFPDETINCRYTNYINDSVYPPYDYSGWTLSGPCETSKLWELSQGVGLKTVYYQVNFSDRNSTFNDTIYYNFTGGGLDTTAPTAPIVYHNNYTNTNNSITINWYASIDDESSTLGIPLAYSVVLYSDFTTLGTGLTTSLNYTFSGFELSHNTVVYANVSAINSGGHKSNTTSDPLIIDLESPNITGLFGSFRNLSALSYESINSVLSEDTWLYAMQTNFSWNGVDGVSNRVIEYSYILTTDTSAQPDNVPEGTIGNFENTKSKSYSGLQSSKYYFKVKAKDLAGNWGPVSWINFSLDNSPPSRPEILTENSGSNSITYTWSESTDEESNIVLYAINLTDESEVHIAMFNQTNINNRSHTFTGLNSYDYNATIGALNGAGIWRWSNQEALITDFYPPEIIALPNITVIDNKPILKAWTNEIANCYYNNSGSNTKFSYSNTTYHETKLSELSDGHYTYVITCTDLSNNEATQNINFSVDTTESPENILGVSNVSGYESLVTNFQINIENNSINFTGISSSRFKIYINNEEIDASVFDLGNSKYNVSFISPTKGSYTLKVELDDNSDRTLSVPLTINELYLNAYYSDIKIGGIPSTTKHITHYVNGSRLGLATDSDLNLKNYVTENQLLNITEIDITDNLFIINTKSTNTILDRERKINNGNFLSLIIPSFGYSITDKYIIDFILNYDNYAIESYVGEELGKGKHQLLVARSTTNGNPVIRFIRSGDDQSVLTG